MARCCPVAIDRTTPCLENCLLDPLIHVIWAWVFSCEAPQKLFDCRKVVVVVTVIKDSAGFCIKFSSVSYDRYNQIFTSRNVPLIQNQLLLLSGIAATDSEAVSCAIPPGSMCWLSLSLLNRFGVMLRRVIRLLERGAVGT